MSIPILLQRGGLRNLNHKAFDKLKAPIFLMSPEPSRPSSASSGVAHLYETVTGLYIVYHDYGDLLLPIFLDDCKSTVPKLTTDIHDACAHIEPIMKLRAGFCHGLTENCRGANDYVSQMKTYLNTPHDPRGWPAYPASLTDEQCANLADTLATESNKLYDVLVKCIQAYSQADACQYRIHLEDKVFNGNEKKHGGYYFNMRVVKMLQPQSGHPPNTTYNAILNTWLNSMKNALINGLLSDEDEPMQRLTQALYAAFGFTPPVRRASATILGGVV